MLPFARTNIGRYHETSQDSEAQRQKKSTSDVPDITPGAQLFLPYTLSWPRLNLLSLACVVLTKRPSQHTAYRVYRTPITQPHIQLQPNTQYTGWFLTRAVFSTPP